MAAPQPGSMSGLDAVVTVSGSVQKYVAKKKKVLNAEEAELYELTQAAGIAIDQEVFKVIVDLLKMNVAPLAVFQMLKSMCAGHRIIDAAPAEISSSLIPPSHTDARAFLQGKLARLASTTNPQQLPPAATARAKDVLGSQPLLRV